MYGTNLWSHPKYRPKNLLSGIYPAQNAFDGTDLRLLLVSLLILHSLFLDQIGKEKDEE